MAAGAALSAVFVFTGCLSAPKGPLSPNASQSVVTVRRASSPTEKKGAMVVLIDGRKEAEGVKNGGQTQTLVMNGIHNIQVSIGKFQSQMLTFDCASEVVEFYANFEGEKTLFKNTTQLSLMKTSGGTGAGEKAAATAGPVINIQVDNSSSNTSNSGGNTMTSTTSSDNSSVVGD
jgi:hypothetical protein